MKISYVVRPAAAIVVVLLAARVWAAEPPGPTKETWQTIALRGQRIGYGHLIETRTEVDGQPVVVTEMRLHTVMKRFDGKLTLIIDQTVQEDLAGNLRSFKLRMDNPPAGRMELTGHTEFDVLKLRTTAGGKTTESQLPAPSGTKSPVYVDRLLEESPLKVDESRTISLFDPQLGTVVTVKATGRGPAEFRLPSGEKQSGTHAIVEYLSGIPGLAVDCFFDVHGRMVLNEAELLGTTTWNCTQAEALAKIPADIDIGLTALVKVDKLPDASRTRRVEYRVSRPQGLPDGLLSESAFQSVERMDANMAKVMVRALRPREVQPVDAPPPDAKYLAATAMARCDDEEIVKLARESAPEEATPAEAAVALEAAVHKWLHRKNMSTNLASASEVVRSREGDCTEHAVLLTALLRARAIPARTVVGLVYWDQYTSFAGHAWTEAWLSGQWVPLDATLAAGGVGADRIRLGDSSLADGDAGMIAGSIATWQLLDQAEIEIVQITRDEQP